MSIQRQVEGRGTCSKKGTEKSSENVAMTVRAGISSSMSDLSGATSGDGINTFSSRNFDAIPRSKGGRSIAWLCITLQSLSIL